MTQIIKSVDCPKEKFKAGDILFKEGTLSNCFYIVRSGRIAIFKNYDLPEGRVHLATLDPGKVLGEISGIDGLPRTATAVAETATEVTKVSSTTLTYQLTQCPGWFRAVVLDLVERLRRTDELIVDNGGPALHRHSSLMSTGEHE